MRALVVGVECRHRQWNKERVWLMFLGSRAGLEVVRQAFGRGMPLGCNLQKEVRRLPVGRLARSSLPLRPVACIARMELGIGMEEVPPLSQKGTEVTLSEAILFRSSEVAVVVAAAAAWLATSMLLLLLALSIDVPSTASASLALGLPAQKHCWSFPVLSD